MDENKLAKLQFLSANIHFVLGTIFLLDFANVIPVPDTFSPHFFLTLAVISYASALWGLLRYMHIDSTDDDEGRFRK